MKHANFVFKYLRFNILIVFLNRDRSLWSTESWDTEQDMNIDRSSENKPFLSYSQVFQKSRLLSIEFWWNQGQRGEWGDHQDFKSQYSCMTHNWGVTCNRRIVPRIHMLFGLQQRKWVVYLCLMMRMSREDICSFLGVKLRM